MDGRREIISNILNDFAPKDKLNLWELHSIFYKWVQRKNLMACFCSMLFCSNWSVIGTSPFRQEIIQLSINTFGCCFNTENGNDKSSSRGEKNNLRRLNKSIVKNGSNHIVHVVVFALVCFFIVYFRSKMSGQWWLIVERFLFRAFFGWLTTMPNLVQKSYTSCCSYS